MDRVQDEDLEHQELVRRVAAVIARAQALPAKSTPREVNIHILQSGFVNIVGEQHDVSEPFREEEAAFVKAMMGTDAGYWTEYEFPAGEGQESADPMELRAAQAAAEVIDQFHILCGLAELVAADGVWQFLSNDLAKFQDAALLLGSSYDIKQVAITADNGNIWLAVGNVTRFFLNTLKKFKKNIDEAITAEFANIEICGVINNLADSKNDTETLLQGLSAAVKLDVSGAASLASQINQKRSNEMLQQAKASSLVGVWKVGQQHIADLRNEQDASPVNIVDQKDFDKAFYAWLASR